MSYIINRTDGSLLTELVDGTIDQTTTDVTLIGKNSSSYGEFLNENIVRLLENFSNSVPPNNPIKGQLWYDTGEGRLKVYDGTSFKVSSGTILSSVIPSSISQGDLWIDSSRRQLYFNDGLSTMLVGPLYTESQGLSGFQTVDVLDINGITHSVVLLFVGQSLLGVFSKSSFTPATTISGYSGDINVGFNVSTLAETKFYVTASTADALVDSFGNVRLADDFVTKSDDSNIVGTLTIQNEIPLILGANSENEIRIDSLAFQLNANRADQNVKINVLHNSQLLPSIFVKTVDQYVGIFTDTPTATLDVNGDAVIQGSLTVKGQLTSINTTNLEITDKLIELSKTESPSNTSASGAGIRILGGEGDGDKDFTWESTVNGWNSTDSINIISGKTFKINGFDVLSYTSLGNSIESAPGLTSVGTLSNLQVDNININDNIISFTNISQSNGDIVLRPKGTGVVDVDSSRIINVSDPETDNDAVNLYTVNRLIQTQSLAISLDTTGLSNADIVTVYLDKLFPPSEYALSSPICRAVCTDGLAVSIKQFFLDAGTWTFQYTL